MPKVGSEYNLGGLVGGGKMGNSLSLERGGRKKIEQLGHQMHP